MSEEDNMSVKAAVDQINESLSNAIPELVLLLVALAEKNAPPPPNVPMSIEGVASAAEILGNVCLSVANDEYQEYPEIQKDIMDNADIVMVKAEALRKAADQLVNTEDRATGYQIVMDAAKGIAGSCITVLIIVYGAFFRRAQALFQNSTNILEDADPCSKKNIDDPQHFADQVGEACTRADETAGRLRELADNEDSPLAKQQLNEAADRIEQASNEFLQAANEYLADLDNEEKRLAAQKAQKALLQAIADANIPVDRLKKQQDEQNAALQKAQESQSAPKINAAKAKADQEKAAKKAIVRPSKASQLANPVPASDKPMDNKTLEQELGIQRDLVDDLVRTAEEGQPQMMVEDAKLLLQRHPVLVQKAMDAAKSPESKQSVVKYANKLAEEIPKLIEAGKKVLANPNDEEARKELEERAEKVNKLIKKLEPSSIEEEEKERLAKIAAEEAKRAAEEQRKREEAAARAPVGKKSRFEKYRVGQAPLAKPAAASASCQDMKECLQNVLVAAPNEDKQQDLADRAADVAALMPHIIRDCNSMAACIRDPECKKKAQDTVKDMEDALKRVQRAAKSVLDATAAKDEPARQAALKELEQAVEDAQDAIEDFENISRAPVVSMVVKAMKDNDKLAASAQKKDKDQIDDDSVELAESACAVINCLRDEAARCPDPARKKALEKCANDLDEALADVLKVARAVRDGTATPEDEAKAAAKLKAVLGGADRLVNPQKRDKNDACLSRFTCTSRTDPEQQSLEKASRAAASILAHADLTADKLENDPEAFRKESERVADELDKAADSIKMTPEEKVAYDAQKLAKDMASLAGAVADGDEDGVEEFLLECNEDEQSLVEGIKAVASLCKDDDPEEAERKKNLLADCANLEKIHEQMCKAARSGSGDLSAFEAVRCCQAGRIVLSDVETNTCGEADAKLAASHKAVLDDIKALREAIAKDDADAARKAAKKLDKDVEELAKVADLIARRDAAVDPAKAERVKELARSVDGTAEDIRQAAKAWDKARKAGDTAGAAEAKARCSKKADTLDKDVKELNQLLNEPYREALAKEAETLNKLANAGSVKHDAKETVAAMRELVQRQKDLRNVEKPKGADRAKQDAALDRIDALMPQAAAATKDCLQKPSAENDKKLRDIVYDMQSELLGVKAAGDNGTEKGKAEDIIVAARKAISDYQRAAAANDSKGMEAAKKSLAKNVEALDELVKDPNSALGNSKCADAAEVQEAMDNLKKLATDIPKNSEQMKIPLDVLARNLEAPNNETVDTKKRIRALAVKARKGATNVNRRNLDDLISAGKNLAGALNGFGDIARVGAAAGEGTKKSNAALALDDLLRQMELGGPMADASVVDKLMEDLHDDQPAEPEEEKSTFSAAIAQVATEIEAAVQTHKAEIVEIPGLDASPLATFLKKLANSARNNERPEMLVSARGVSSCIVAFCKELTQCAKRCKDPIFQDKMYASIAALKNFGTQVKILASVKAASTLDESDSDEQIINVVRSLGKTTTDALASIEITNKANLLRK